MKWRNKSTLITGGAGFIGSHLVETLLKKKARVTVIDNYERGQADNLEEFMEDIKFHNVDLRTDYPNLPQFDYVYDLAARVWGITNLYAQPATILADNLQIITNTLKHNLGCRKYIYCSSSCVYDYPNAVTPHKEEDYGYVNSEYGWSKVIGEMLCKAYYKEIGLNYIVVRPFNVYGPKESLDFPHVIPDFIEQAYKCQQEKRDQFEILGDGEQTRSFTYVSDLIDGFIAITERGERGVYNIGSERESKINTIANIILRHFKLDIPIVHKPKIIGDVRRRKPDCSKAKQDLSWEPQVSLDQGLRKTINWYLDNLK